MRAAGVILPTIGAIILAGCGLTRSSPLPTIPSGATIDCGALVDEALCRTAVQVAITAQLNPPPIARASIRRPAVDDDCLTLPHPCDASSVIVTLQSGDTLQEVALMRSGAGWVRLDLVR